MDTADARTEMMPAAPGVALDRGITKFSTMLPITDSVVVEKSTLVLGIDLLGLRLSADGNGVITLQLF